MKISNRVDAMQFSPIRKFNGMAIEAEAQGVKVYHLNIGQPDVKTPACFMDAIRGFDKEVIAYAESSGITDLQDAIIDYFKNYDIFYERSDILVTAGGSEALTILFTSILDPGDEVLMAEPFYTNYDSFVKAACGRLVPITTSAEDGYNYADREKIEKAITPNTRAICCINPGNPTGTILSKEDMQLIVDIAKEHELWIIADEVYREFAYDGRTAVSFGNFEEAADRVVIVDSVSKRFSACGARIGCLITKNEELQKAVLKIAQSRLCVSTLDQVGVAALYRLGPDYYADVKAEYEGRRDAVYEEVMKIPGAFCKKPGGAFYMTVKLPVDDMEAFLTFLLKEYRVDNETVMFAPEEGFYETAGLGKDELRIAYVLQKEELVKGVQLIRSGLEAFQNRK